MDSVDPDQLCTIGAVYSGSTSAVESISFLLKETTGGHWQGSNTLLTSDPSMESLMC